MTTVAVGQRLTLWNRICFSKALVSAQSALCVLSSRAAPDGVLALTKGSLTPRPPGRSCTEAQVQLQPVPCPGTPDKSQQAITNGQHLHWALGCPLRLNLELRLSAASVRLMAAQQEVWDMLWTNTACLGFVNL